MAYADLISLKQTIQRLVKISSHVSTKETLESANVEVCKLQEAVGWLESSGWKNSQSDIAWAVQIRERVYKLEDVLESDVSCGFLSGSEIDGSEVRSEINSFIQMAKKAWKQCEEGRSRKIYEYEEDEEDVRSYGVIRKRLEIVELEDEYDRLLEELLGRDLNCRILSLVGMAGIGKTTLATEVWENPKMPKHFDFRAFVTVGPNCKVRHILLRILCQLGYDIDHLSNKDDHTIGEYLYKHLYGRRYLIVMDDMWHASIWDRLRPFLTVHQSGGRVLVISRSEGVLQCDAVHRMRFLSKEESWKLLCLEVFGRDKSCPFQLEKAGREIADLCEGLPLAVVTVASLLSKAEQTVEYWMNAAERKNSVFTDAEDLMFEVLSPSFENLPSYLRPCFLYMGVFMPKSEIHSSKLIGLWSAEGLVEPNPDKTFEDFSMECLEALVSRSLIMLSKASSIGRIKTCRLHFAFRSLCIKVAKTNKFFHVINSYASTQGDGIENQRRLCVNNNTVFGIKDIYSSMESITTVRSLLCIGPYHSYMVPMCFRLRLLRVLHVLTIRFYEFPKEVQKLILLKYLAVTCNDEIPGLISKLCNLQYLIVCRHQSIKNGSARMCLPVEIWDMKELKHIHFAGGDMPEPVSKDSSLPNLSSLSGITAYSCTEGILAKIPKLEKLGIQIELASDATVFMHCFEHLSCLAQLKSLKCIILHPNLRAHLFLKPWHDSPIFLQSLEKLTLSGFGCLFEALDAIGLLPNLQVLKLRCYAFHGPIWKVDGKRFLQLRHLQIEDTNLKQWIVEEDSFPLLERLIIRHCYTLELIPAQIIWFLQKIELVDCNPPFVSSVMELIEDYALPMEVHVHSSHDEEKKR